MTTKLQTEEFEKRLAYTTKDGEPLIMSSPFAVLTMLSDFDKPFYGEFGNGQFRLTRNSVMPFSNAGYIIKGDYTKDEISGTNLKYKINPVWFKYIGVRVTPILMGIMINIAFYLSSEKIDLGQVIAVNAFIILLEIFAIKLDKMTKTKLEKLFLKEFEVTH